MLLCNIVEKVTSLRWYVTNRTKRSLKNLQEKNVITRIGNNRNGEWRIL